METSQSTGSLVRISLRKVRYVLPWMPPEQVRACCWRFREVGHMEIIQYRKAWRERISIRHGYRYVDTNGDRINGKQINRDRQLEITPITRTGIGINEGWSRQTSNSKFGTITSEAINEERYPRKRKGLISWFEWQRELNTIYEWIKLRKRESLSDGKSIKHWRRSTS